MPTQIFEGDVLFIEWSAKAASTFVEDGIDTFVFRDGDVSVRFATLCALLDVVNEQVDLRLGAGDVGVLVESVTPSSRARPRTGTCCRCTRGSAALRTA